MKSIEEIFDESLEIEGLLALLVTGKSQFDSSIYDLLSGKVTTFYNDIMALSKIPQIYSHKIDDDSAIADSTVFEEVGDSEVLAPSAQFEQTVVTSPKLTRNDVMPVELTINDKFRFRNELFGGNQNDLDETMQVISTMSSFDEVQAYLYDDLCLDPNSDVVKDFVATIHRMICK